ncbi:hypothetical protein [Hymenobacter fodinae]|uniref:Uncharacterized protein n=1 Tax=Hymenobacter fodinae TaxID=2510796 RepID=A0A4Z0P4A4_9BACT|nr:hypothetical protein [Hymenobacter fodinae]TGE06494.1 hypothetical protein EU556_16805 [Hymenobacter fodinae]
MYKISTLTNGVSKPQLGTSTLVIEGPNIVKAAFYTVAGVALLYHSLYVFGVISLAIAVFAITTNKGIELDLTSRHYRLFTSSLGIRMGDWETIPAVQHITMKYFSDLVTFGRPGRMRIDKDQRYLVMFSILNSTEGVILHKFQKYDSALKLARFLADALSVEVKLYDHF